MDNYDQDEIKLNIWINGKGQESFSKVVIDSCVNTLKRLKDVISNTVRNKHSTDKMMIFNYKGLEVDEVDIQYLKQDQVLFVSLDGQPFNSLNYLNQYEFVKYLKSGGYGKIYIARDVITNESVAVKKIETNVLSSEEIYNMSREAVYLESFKHKHIIKIYSSFLLNNNFYSIMQLAKGGELDTYLKEKKVLDETEAKRIFKMIHEAVRYIHSKNVIHRDLNLVNILFLDETRENIVIIDFGISGFYSGNIKEKINAGTVRFVPPEVASGTNFSSNPKIDNWALGVILYVMLFGVYPFDGTNENEILLKISAQPNKIPTGVYISKTCKQILSKLLDKNPNFRLELNDDILDTWYDEKFEIPIITPDKEKNEIDPYTFYQQISLDSTKESNLLSEKKMNSAGLKKGKVLGLLSATTFKTSTKNVTSDFPNEKIKRTLSEKDELNSNLKKSLINKIKK